MTTAVVLGGSGFLGRHVVAALRKDPRVERVVAPGRDRLDLLRAGPDDLVDLLGDLGAQVVVNAVGRLDGANSELVEANTLLTARLLDALTVVPARLVRIGSAGEYGVVPDGMAAHEDSAAFPVSAYGASHLAATRLLELAVRDGRADAVTLRVFNPIGPGIGPQTVLGRAATYVRQAARDGETTVRLGPLDAFRDFVDVRDVAAAVVSAGFSTTPHATINIGSGRAVRVREAVRRLAEAAGFAGTIEEESPRGRGRSAGVGWMMADIRRGREELGWSPSYRLEESLASIWEEQVATHGARTP